MSYQHKYLKYKQKYLSLKNTLNLNMVGGNAEEPQNQENDLLNLSALPITPTDTEVYGHSLKKIGGEEPKAAEPEQTKAEEPNNNQEQNNNEPKADESSSSTVESTSESETSESETSESKNTTEETSEETSEEDSPIKAPEMNQTGGNVEKDTLDISELSSISDSELN